MDVGPAAVHALLLLLLPAALQFRRPRGDAGRSLLLVVGIGAAGFALLCLALKWQEWNVRFLASLVGVLAPAVAVVYAAGRIGRATAVALTVVLAWAAIPTVLSYARTVFTPASVLRRDPLAIRCHYVGGPEDVAAVAHLARSRRAVVIGFANCDGDPNYLYMRVMRDLLPWRPVFEYVNATVPVRGTSHRRADLVIAPPGFASLTDAATGTRYRLETKYERFIVLVPEPGPTATPGTVSPSATGS